VRVVFDESVVVVVIVGVGSFLVSFALAGPAATSASPTVPIAITVLARRRSGSDGESMWVRVFMGFMLGHGKVSA
jgi:hypothetical protein